MHYSLVRNTQLWLRLVYNHLSRKDFGIHYGTLSQFPVQHEHLVRPE